MQDDAISVTNTGDFDKCQKTSKKGVQYWNARDIVGLLDYSDWEAFSRVIDRAKTACERAGVAVDNHFLETTEKVALGSGATGKRATYFLSRYGCYLIAMNGDPTKQAIAVAQTYFAVQTRRQEIADDQAAKETPEVERLKWRERLTDATRGLNSAAKSSGVQRYAIFHDAGYRGLYGLGLQAIKSRKGIKENEHLFDRAGSSELAANFFRATQARERLEREGIKNESSATKVHHDVGREIRATIAKLGNKMPEDLPAEVPIKTLKKKLEPKQLK